MTIPGMGPGRGCGAVDDETAWCVETARHLRCGAGEAGGSLVFLRADDARRLADVLDGAAHARRVPSIEAPHDANGEWLCQGDVAMTESGDRVVVVGVGMGCVFAVDADALTTVIEGGGHRSFRRASALELLWRMVNHSEACWRTSRPVFCEGDEDD